MPIFANRIVFGADPEDADDYFAFEDMRGRLQPMSEQLEGIIRGGHRGESIRTSGVRAVPSQLLTLHYVGDFYSAQYAIEAYITLKDGNPYRIIQHSANYGYFKILDVQDVEARLVVNVLGSIIADPTVLQVCQWTVLATDAPE